MDFDMAGVYHQPLEVRIIDENLEQLFPNALVAPTAETTMCVFPVPIIWWQVTPGRSGSKYP